MQVSVFNSDLILIIAKVIAILLNHVNDYQDIAFVMLQDLLAMKVC